MSKKTHIAAFAAGLGVGFAAAWLFAKDKYKRLADEEIKSVMQAFSKRKPLQKKKETEEYAKTIKRYTEPEVVEDKNISAHPYIISPEEYDEPIDYEKITLTLYSDGVLVDEDDEPVINEEEIVGLDYRTRFGEYEQSTVYVRNDLYKCDYEILADDATFK